MKVTVLGTRKVSFEDKKTGEYVKGTSIYVAYPDEDVKGLMADKVFIKDGADVFLPDFEFGEQYDFVYEGLGKRTYLSAIRKVEE